MRWNPISGAGGTIGEVGRDGEHRFLSEGEHRQALLPPGDDVALAEREAELSAAAVRGVEFKAAVHQNSFVV